MSEGKKETQEQLEQKQRIKELGAKISESRGGAEEIQALRDYLSALENREVIFKAAQNLGDIAMLPTIARLLQSRMDEIDLQNNFMKVLNHYISDPKSRSTSFSPSEEEVNEQIAKVPSTLINFAIAHFEHLNDTKYDIILEKLRGALQEKAKSTQEESVGLVEKGAEYAAKKIEKHKGRFQGLRNIFYHAKSERLKEEVIKVSELEVDSVESDTDEIEADALDDGRVKLSLVGLEEEATGLRKLLQSFKSKDPERKNRVLEGLKNLGANIQKLFIQSPVNEQIVSLTIKLSNQKEVSVLAHRYNDRLERLISLSNREDLIKAERELRGLSGRAYPTRGIKVQVNFNKVAEDINNKISKKLDAKQKATYEHERGIAEPLATKGINSAPERKPADIQPVRTAVSSFSNDEAGLRSILADLQTDIQIIKLVDDLDIEVQAFEKEYSTQEYIDSKQVEPFRKKIEIILNELSKNPNYKEILKRAEFEIRAKFNSENTTARHTGLRNVVSILQSKYHVPVIPVKSQKVQEAFLQGSAKAKKVVSEAKAVKDPPSSTPKNE